MTEGRQRAGFGQDTGTGPQSPRLRAVSRAAPSLPAAADHSASTSQILDHVTFVQDRLQDKRFRKNKAKQKSTSSLCSSSRIIYRWNSFHFLTYCKPPVLAMSVIKAFLR